MKLRKRSKLYERRTLDDHSFLQMVLYGDHVNKYVHWKWPENSENVYNTCRRYRPTGAEMYITYTSICVMDKLAQKRIHTRSRITRPSTSWWVDQLVRNVYRAMAVFEDCILILRDFRRFSCNTQNAFQFGGKITWALMGELTFFRDIFETKRFMKKLKRIKFIPLDLSYRIKPQ